MIDFKNIKYFKASGATVRMVRKNVFHVSIDVDGHPHVFELTRTQIEAFASELDEVLQAAALPTRRPRARKD